MRMEKAVCQRRVQRGRRPGWPRCGQSAESVREAGSPGAPEPGAMALPGERRPRPQARLWEAGALRLRAPCVLTTLPRRRGGRDRRPQPAAPGGRMAVPAPAFRPRSRRTADAAGLGEGCPAAARAAGPGCQATLAAPRRRWGRRGHSARGLLSQGWPSLFDKLIAWRGLAGPGVTPVTTKVELEEIRLKERGKKKN